MNRILNILVWLTLCFLSGNGDAQTCQPYSIPIEPAVACGTGYTGSKFAMKTKTCPGGQVTVGVTYNTDNCRPVTGTVDQNATNCAMTPTVVGCSAAPTLQGCAAGKHWVTTGSGIAHCVANDYACPWGQSLTHDGLGNPYCVANTCPSNQVLQGDGISCACSSGLVWNGSSCIVACTPVTTTEASACSSGYSGTMYRDRTQTCPSGTLVYGAWDTSSCSLNCPSSTSTTGSCGAGYTGSTIITTSYSATCTSIVNVDSSGCLVIVPTPTGCPSPTSTTSAGSCPAGYTGNTSITTTTTYSGGSCTASSSTSVNSSGCTLVPVSCPSPTSTTSTGSCGTGYTGNTVITTTTTYSGGSCTASSSTSVDRSGCVFLPICTPGIDMQILTGGVCVDCASVGWNPTSLSLNYTSVTRACYSNFNTNGD